MSDSGEIHHQSERGIVATHPEREAQPFLVAPTTESDFNTLGLDIVPVACLQLRDILFEFDSSFPKPDVALMLKEVPGLRERNKNSSGQLPPLSVFGHADPVGNDDYNKQLSGRRAMAIYGALTHDVKLWDFLFDNPFGGDDWKAKNVQSSMRSALGETSSKPRRELVEAYMKFLFPVALQKSDFLGRGGDAKGKADFQGCSEFNPLVILSTKENQTLAKAKRDSENTANRRVVIFLFRAGLKINPAVWPCPTALAGTAECRKRFFGPPKTGDERRKSGAERREFAKTEDTFGCRFYDRVARVSPCEKPVPPVPDVNPIIVLGSSAPRPSESAIRDANITGRNFVVVKKPYTKPARVPVTLKSDRQFEGSGEFTIQENSNLRFFREKDSLLPMRFDGADNVFTGEQLSPPGPGVTVFAEGIKASRAVDDITLTLTISAKFATIAKVARVQMTAIDVILDIAAPRTSPAVDPVPLPQPTTATAPPGHPTDKLFGGRLLRLQDAGNNQERAMLIVRLRPESFVTTLELTSKQTTVSIFENENPKSAGSALTLPLAIPSSTITANGRRFFVQGDQLSNSFRDVQLELGIQGVEPDCDRVAVTVSFTVGSLQASLASTKNAASGVRPAAGTFRTTNAALAFAAPTADLLVVIQNAGEIPVQAQNIQPPTAANRIRWQIDRDPADTVATGTPSLDTKEGAQVKITPNTPGSFRLICYRDFNGNNKHENGEELRVLRMVIVRITPQAGATLTATKVFTGSPNGVSTGGAVNPMTLQADFLLEGGGANRRFGLDQVVLANVGNLINDTFVVNYPGRPPPNNTSNGTATEDPDFRTNPAPGFPAPMVDTVNVAQGAQPTGGTTPNRGNSVETVLGNGPGGNGQLKRINSLDAPAFGWSGNHPTTGNPWATTQGANFFREWILAHTVKFPRNYVALGTGDWTVTATGTNTGGNWTDNGATVTGTAWTIAGFPKTADDAAAQVLGVSFVREFGMIINP